MSREHFTVTKSGNSFKLLAVSSNPMWRQHGDELLELKKQELKQFSTCGVGFQDSASLVDGPKSSKILATKEHGDRIWLYTGASDGQPAGPGHKGTIASTPAFSGFGWI